MRPRRLRVRPCVGGVLTLLVVALLAPPALAQHEPPNAQFGEISTFTVTQASSDPTGATLSARYDTTPYHDQQCAGGCNDNQFMPYTVQIYLDTPDGKPVESVYGSVGGIPHCTPGGGGDPLVTCDTSYQAADGNGRKINNPADALPSAGTITFKPEGAVPPNSTAEIVVEGYSINSYAKYPVTLVDHYTIELRAWIPHQRIVDPIWPLPLFLHHSTLDSCLHASGPGVQSSDVSGDGHVGYDGSYRGQVAIAFDWDGQNMKQTEGAPPSAPVYSHRNWEYSFLAGGVRPCTEEKLANNKNTADVKDGIASLSILTAFPFFTLWPSKHEFAPPIGSRLEATFENRTSLSVTMISDTFPSHGFRVMKNGKPLFTVVSQNSSCVNAAGVLGAANLLFRLNDYGGNIQKFLIDTATTNPVDEVLTCHDTIAHAIGTAIRLLVVPGFDLQPARNGEFSIPGDVSCSIGPCRLSATATADGGAGANALGSRREVLASLTTTIRSRQVAPIVLRMTHAGRDELKKDHRIKARVTTVVTDSTHKRSSRTLTLHLRSS